MKPESIGELGLSPQNRDWIVRGMQRAFESGGTAAGIKLPGLNVAGKTGTAEVSIRNVKQPNNSLFVCFAPVENPIIAIAVVVEGGGMGADSAAPIARRMLAQYFRLKVGTMPIGRHLGGD